MAPHDFHYYIAPSRFAEKGLQKTAMVADRPIYANIASNILEDPLMTWKSKMPSPVRDTIFREYATAGEDRPVAVDCALDKGLILITFGKHGNVLRVAPPLNIPDELLDEALEIMNASLEDAAGGKISEDILPLLKGW
jgi:hypothetical protein